jgi:hypothetical protein
MLRCVECGFTGKSDSHMSALFHDTAEETLFIRLELRRSMLPGLFAGMQSDFVSLSLVNV